MSTFEAAQTFNVWCKAQEIVRKDPRVVKFEMSGCYGARQDDLFDPDLDYGLSRVNFPLTALKQDG